MLLIKSIQWINKDKKNRKYFLNVEIKKMILKSLIYNNIEFNYFKMFYDIYFKKFSFAYSISRYRKNCMFLGNSKSVFTRFKMSRHICKKMANFGFINGLKKASF